MVAFTLLFFNKTLVAQTLPNHESEDAIDLLDDRLDSLDALALQKPYIQISGNYVSQVAYNGRTEGVTQFGVSPSATWHIGKGFLLNYNGTIWSAAKPSAYTYTSVGAAKVFKIGDFETQIGYNRLFFNDTVPARRADFNQEIEVTAHYSVGDFSFDAYFLRLGGRTIGHYMAPSVSWEKSGRFGSKRQYRWSIAPTVSVELGDDAVSQIIQTGKRKALIPRIKKKTFGLLNYPMSLVASLKTQTTEVSVGYVYNLPQNVALPNISTAIGYFEIEIKKRFGW